MCDRDCECLFGIAVSKRAVHRSLIRKFARSDGLQHSSDGLQPTSTCLALEHFALVFRRLGFVAQHAVVDFFALLASASALSP